ncbi:MAG: YhdT family protein [Enterobacteriaceae bacterium]|nr:YhdT family protein [Enterobacteriaceae bacterium]
MTDPRFIQAHKEASWAVGLTIAYMIAWTLAAYLPDNKLGITGLPHWFEMACLLIPLIFTLLCWLMVRFVFRDIPLEDNNDAI